MNYRKVLLRSLVCVLMTLSYGVVASAEYVSPDLVEIKTTRYDPAFFYTGVGTYHYDISWQGISVAEGKIRVDEQMMGTDSKVRVHASAYTGGVIAAVYRLQHDSASVFDGLTFTPHSFHVVQSENNRVKYSQVYFEKHGIIEADRWKKGKEEHEFLSFMTDNFTLDPIGAIFYARSLPIKIGAGKSFDIFNGKHRYLITLTVEAIEPITIGGRLIDAYKVVPEVQKLTDTDGEDKLRSATIWLSADDNRHILRLKSEVWIGSIVAEMQSFVPKRVAAESHEIRARPALAHPSLLGARP